MSPTAQAAGDQALKIAFVMPGIGIENRGAEAFVVELAAALAIRGLAPVIFSRGMPPPSPGVGYEPIRAIPRDARWLDRAYRATRITKKVLDTLFLDPLSIEWGTAALSARGRIARGGFDLLVMEGGLVGARVARWLKSRRGLPWIDLAHGNDPKWEGAFARQNPDRVVCFTEAAARMIRERAPRAKIQVIPHGVDLERFTMGLTPVDLDLERPIVLTAGAIDSHKRMGLAVQALARLGRGSLVALGRGPEEETLDALGSRLLGPRRYLRTAVPRAEMPRWYAAADCFTLPSKTESFGLTYLEAMACGKPVVATDDAVRREVIGEAGRFCDPEDLDAYALALGEGLDRNWGEGTENLPRRRAERFPVGSTIDAYAALCAELAR
ncbi:MAG TPA: glycosyltransferase [Thermoanaerobaculia bacterium]|nr:glycosyltransferase [Thermoanaerobaculia bacterium]